MIDIPKAIALAVVLSVIIYYTPFLFFAIKDFIRDVKQSIVQSKNWEHSKSELYNRIEKLERSGNMSRPCCLHGVPKIYPCQDCLIVGPDYWPESKRRAAAIQLFHEIHAKHLIPSGLIDYMKNCIDRAFGLEKSLEEKVDEALKQMVETLGDNHNEKVRKLIRLIREHDAKEDKCNQ